MSYVRFSDESDVYVYDDVYVGLRCCACKLQGDFHCGEDYTAMLDHLGLHMRAGQKVPDRATLGLMYERDHPVVLTSNVEATETTTRTLSVPPAESEDK